MFGLVPGLEEHHYAAKREKKSNDVYNYLLNHNQ